MVIEEKRMKYFMNVDNVRQLAGLTIKEISRRNDAIFIEFTDGTGMGISNDRPIPASLMVYHWMPGGDK
jgi:hypothetical protein